MNIRQKLVIAFLLTSITPLVAGLLINFYNTEKVLENADIDESKVLVIVSGMMEFSIITIAVSVIAVLVVAVLFSNVISSPIVKLREAADRISKGQLDEKIQIGSKDEIGKLTETFDNMRYSLKMVIDEYENEKLNKEKFLKSSEKKSEKEGE